LKKGLPSVFTLLLLMNIIGYYGVFVGLEIRNDTLMVERINSEKYSEDETLTLKIPITVPYARDEEDFQRVDGKFEHNGEYYRLVKHRLAKDTLTIICVKDTEEKKIKNTLSFYVKTFADTQPGTNHSKKTIQLIKDYIQQSIGIHLDSFGWSTIVVKQGSLAALIPSFSPTIIQPPEGA